MCIRDRDIYEEITQKVELCSPVTMTDSFISNYYGIDPDKLEEYVFSMSEDATSAETIIIMKVRNEADTEEISAALETVRDEDVYKRQAMMFLSFAGPAVILFSAVVIVPFIFGLYLTFTGWDGISSSIPFVGFENYLSLFKDTSFWIRCV